jgi:transketolase
MGLEDLSMMRSIHGSTVLYPCDGNQTAKLVRAMADQPGISYIRTTRGKTPIIYTPDEDFRPGGSKVVRSTGNDQVTLVGAGITLHEALKAADMLFDEGISVRVIDAYSIKPIDAETLRHAARETAGLVVSEDHWASGGLGDAVLEVFADEDIRPRVIKLAVREMPGSGTPEEQLDAVGIGCRHIAEAARRLVAVAAV